MTWADYALLALIGASVLVGVLRGFVQEVFALAVWVAAFLAAWSLGEPAAEWIGDSITLPSARLGIAYAGVFLVALLVGGLLNYLVGRLVDSTGLSGSDRLVGAVFGAVRGLALVVVLLLVAGMTPLTRDPWWDSSTVIQRLLPVVEWSRGLLPEAIAEVIDLDPEPLAADRPEDPAPGEAG